MCRTFVQRGAGGLGRCFYRYGTRGHQNRLRDHLFDPVHHTAERGGGGVLFGVCWGVNSILSMTGFILTWEGIEKSDRQPLIPHHLTPFPPLGCVGGDQNLDGQTEQSDSRDQLISHYLRNRSSKNNNSAIICKHNADGKLREV